MLRTSASLFTTSLPIPLGKFFTIYLLDLTFLLYASYMKNHILITFSLSSFISPSKSSNEQTDKDSEPSKKKLQQPIRRSHHEVRMALY